jgi:antitoxin VapB
MVELRGGKVALNIKSDEAHKLARQLAKLTGESLTDTVITAIRERLSRVRLGSKPELADRLTEIGKDCAAQIKEPYRSIDHGELLYNEKGLPR